MDDRIVDEVTGWESEPFPGGYGGLHRLADREFTGAVEARGAYLFLLNGTALGVADGTVERFEGADGTAYVAPHPSLALLFAMQERGGDTRGRYYTEDTPVEEVDGTLVEGGFTGYLELSENVLSGDYYAVYQQGKSMNVAFVGQSRRVVTGEEAWEKTRDEVGIYEVTSVDLDVLEIPGGDDGSAVAGGATGDEPADTTAERDDTTTPTDEPDGATATADLNEGPDRGETGEADATTTPPPDDDVGDATGAAAGAGPVASEPDRGTDHAEAPTTDTTGEETRAGDDAPVEEPATTGDEGGEPGAAGTDGEVRAVPSVDPERSARAGEDDGGTDAEEPTRDPDAEEPTRDPDAAAADIADDLEAELAEREEELAEAKRRLSELRDRRDDLKRQLEQVRDERDELRTELERLRADDGGPVTSLSPPEARSGTSLFVRYGSKGKTTLEDVRDGDVTESDLRDNLRLEYHTRFDDEAVVVDGQPFEEFLYDTQEYRFLEWLVTGLFFEIRGTGNAERLSKLYGAIQSVDRVELDGAVAVEREDEEFEVGFDLVARDRMGQPLVVANLNDSRDPVTEGAMVDLVEGATGACETDDHLAGAFSVAARVVDPDALETAREATSGSLLSWDKRKSFVKLSRNRGYHLCLVEARDGTFHLSVPDL
jgi:hypothetical protein